MRSLLRLLVRLVVGLAIITVTIVLIRALDARKLPDLRAWHTVELESEYRVRRDGDIDDFATYLAQEQRVFDELNQKLYATSPASELSGVSRFTRNSPFNSQNHERDWNRTVELIPEEPIGGVLMLHGLTDSPYSMRSTAELFHARGFYVLALRLPGHGTAPGALRHASAEDWQAVVEPAAQHIRSIIGADRPFVVAGYSNGGLLGVNYTLDALGDDTLPMPNQLMLMSPAIGVSPFAIFATWHKALSWLPFFEKFQWQDVLPEYDPYKYNSFPKSAGHETYALTQLVQERLSLLGATESAGRFPPVMAFVPLVDASVSTADTANYLFARLNRPVDELVIYDVNQFGPIKQFLRSDYKTELSNAWDNSERRFGLTVVTNRTQDSDTMLARTSLGGHVSEHPIEGRWPDLVYSLSHVAIPFPHTDTWYGDSSAIQGKQVSLGTLAPRGEKKALIVPAELLLRLRYNPFYAYQASRVNEVIEGLIPHDKHPSD